MKIDFIKSNKEWDAFLAQQNGTFLQSCKWGEFKKNYQNVFRIEARENNKIRGVCQFFEEKSPFGKYFYIPHGPISDTNTVSKKLIKKIKEIGSEKKIVFIKTEPLTTIGSGKEEFFRIQPRKTLISKIDDNPEKIIKKFKKKIRHNIRSAERKGVVGKKGKTPKDIEIFYELLLRTKERKNFESYGKNYFEQMVIDNNCDIILAKHNDKILTAIIVLYFANKVYFLHSANDYAEKKLNGSSVARFTALKIAKERGCSYYDFWGIDENKFPGVSEFKKGFNGNEFIYPKGEDFIINKYKYCLFLVSKKMKNKFRK